MGCFTYGKMTWELLEGVYTLHDHVTNAQIRGETNTYNFKKITVDYRCKCTWYLLAMNDTFIPKLVHD
jgi:hypothetical protein